MPEAFDEHYLRTVTQLGDVHPVVTGKPIYAGNRIKLLDQGVRVNSALYERIVRHKLSVPLEQSLTAEKSVTVDEIAERAARTVIESEQFGLVASALGESVDLGQVFRGIVLLEPIAFKLTVAREMRPAVLAHSIDVALLAVFLAARCGASADEIRNAAVAGLLHDMGELHLDPEVLSRTGQLSEAERRQIYSHPLTAFLSLSEYPAYHPAVSTAVLEHHERLDGSGYPRGIRGLEISPLGRILCLAEVVGVLMRASWGIHRAAKIIMVLKVGRQKFDRKLLDHVISLFGSVRTADGGRAARPEAAQAEAVTGAIGRIASVLRDWEKVYRPRASRGGAGEGDPLLGFVNERVASLAQVLVEAGFDFHDTSSFALLDGDDPGGLEELTLLARESLWQLREIMLELRRRWKEFQNASPSNRTAVQGWLDRSSDQVAPV